jgi:hypothetical protein
MNDNEFRKRAEICEKDYDGIFPYVEVFYIHSVLFCTSRALNSFSQYDQIPKTQDNASALVALVQEAVGQAAALSRFFWPSPNGKKHSANLKKSRGEKLRRCFQIMDTSPLFNREMRNTWEHFDERLDEYFLKVNAGEFFPDCIIGNISEFDLGFQHVFKLLDPTNKCLVLLNQQFYFDEIREAVQDVHEKAERMSLNGGRL